MTERLFAALSATRSWSNYFQSDSLDEVRAFIGQRDGPNTRVVRRDGPMGYAIYQLKGINTMVGASQSATPQVVRGNITGSAFLLQVPIGTTYQAGRRLHGPTVANSVVAAPPLWQFTRNSPPGRLAGVEVQQRAMLAELAARRDEGAGKLTQSFAVHQLKPDDHECLLEAMELLIHAMWPGTPEGRLAMAEARFIGLAADLALRRSTGHRVGDLSIDRTRQLEEWIEANLNEPLTIGRLCQVADVGARSLQKTFIHRRGVSPMRFVLERRIVAAYHRLVRAAPDNPINITQVALELGFTHLGRFSQVYRQVVGELPSETLAGRSPQPTP